MDFESRWLFADLTATEQLVEAIPLGLPRLREYTGPYKLLHLFVPIPTLRRVTVLRCNSTHFLGRLHALHHGQVTGSPIQYIRHEEAFLISYSSIFSSPVKPSALSSDTR
jgi:hypothetical protein